MRIDVYLPDGSAAKLNNGTILSDIRSKPDNAAFYSTRIQLPPQPIVGNESGVWMASATYQGNTVEAKFTVR